jgi:hypothetical protein
MLRKVVRIDHCVSRHSGMGQDFVQGTKSAVFRPLEPGLRASISRADKRGKWEMHMSRDAIRLDGKVALITGGAGGSAGPRRN